jgi:hypothetical protein
MLFRVRRSQLRLKVSVSRTTVLRVTAGQWMVVSEGRAVPKPFPLDAEWTSDGGYAWDLNTRFAVRGIVYGRTIRPDSGVGC